MGQLFGRVAAQVLFLDRLPLVVLFLAPRQGDVQLGVAVFGDKQAAGDDGQAFFLDGLGQFAQEK